MKSIRWIGWVALAALCMVPLVASPAWAAWSGTTAGMSQPVATDGDYDSCAILAWRGTLLYANLAGTGDDVRKTRWYNYAGPSSTKVPVMSFRISNASGDNDTLISMYVHSLNERTNAISKIYLYRDLETDTAGDPAHYYDAGDVLLQQLNVSTPFQTNDSILFAGLADVIPTGHTVWYHLVVDMNTAAITGQSTYDGTGVMVELRTNRVLLGQSGARNYGPSAPVPDPVGGIACTPESPANNAYSIIIDNQAPTCASLGFNLVDIPCPDACDGGQTVISLGDSMLINLQLDISNVATDSTATGWPKIFIGEFSTFSAAQSMNRDAGAGAFNGDFSYVKQPATTDYLNIPTAGSVYHPIDVNANFYYLVAETKDAAGNVGRCSTLVANPIDTKKPAITLTKTFALYYDANGNGIVNPGDTIRIFVDMSNEPFGEICTNGVTTSLYGWYAAPLNLTLNDNAGDRKFEVKWKVLPGILDAPAMSWQDSIQVHVGDNACNNDSALLVLNNPVDNKGPQVSAWNAQFYRLLDTDSNGCLMIGEKVRIRVANADIDSDLTAIYANIMSAGMGDSANIVYSRHVLYNQGGGIWLLDWTLGDDPQDSAVQATEGPFQVWLYGVDDAANYDSVATLPLSAGLDNPNAYTMDTKYPTPVSNLSCTSVAHGVINLYWTITAPDADRFAIYFDNGTGTINYASPLAMELNGAATTWTTDGTITLVDGKIYKFDVWTRDHCGNWERVHPSPTACEADASPAWVCVIQPDTGGVYCGNYPLTVYVCPDTTADRDVVGVTAWGRTANRGDGQPGDWVPLGTNRGSADNAVCFQIDLDTAALNGLVGTDTTKLIQVAITTVDDAGNTNTPDQAWAHVGCLPFHFYWTTETIAAQVSTINGTLPLTQPYCGGDIGWSLSGSTNSVTTCLTDSGVGPYWVLAYLDCNAPKGAGKIAPSHTIKAAGEGFPGPQLNGDEIFYGQGEPGCVTFNMDVSKLSKGPCRLEVHWIDVCGQDAWAYANLCIPDSVAPCAEVTNPVDGKCIRRSWSTIDTVKDFEIQIHGNDLTPGGKGCIDQNNVLKVDFQWAKACCVGAGIDTTGWSYFTKPGGSVSPGGTCDTTYFPPPFQTFIKRITCSGVDTLDYVLDSTAITTSCDAGWQTFAIDSAIDEIDGQGVHHHHGPKYETDWMNYNDLSWVTMSGVNIFIRGIVYDDQGNVFYTPCVQVCVDIDTPPLCLKTNDLCGTNRISDRAKLFAELDWPNGNVDDIEHIYLFTKKTDDPDLFSSWESWGDGDRATNATMWTWDLNTDNHHNNYFQDQTYYDFRVIAKTTTGSWSYDFNGDGQFDAHTFDTTHCDAKTWLIDNSAPNIAIDTAWTTINGNTLVIPNTDCRLSDPKGYIWTQYGNSITVQPTVYPLGNIGDIVKTQWTLYDGSGRGADCDCRGPYAHFDDNGAGSYVFAVNEGSHAMDKLVFDPAKAPFVHVRNGYQHHVLHVQGWDACGNETDDCVEIYLLDVDTTEAIIIDPMNDEVFCDQMLSDGGIQLTSATLLENSWKTLVFAYRPVGSSTWIKIDSVTTHHDNGTHHTESVTWYPKALGLPDGAYEVVVWAVDAALNKQTNLYPITVHLSCAQPTVALTYPTAVDPKFLGCPLELTATASSSDPGNPITEVDFYVQSILEDEAHWIGFDDYTVDGMWSVHWDPKTTLGDGFKLTDELSKDANGSYYIFAIATNMAGIADTSAKVKVKYDATPPWTYVIQVNGDRSDGGSTDPTIVTSGETVPLYVLSADNRSPAGYGLTNNCGLDSVIVYVSNDSTEAYPTHGKIIFGGLMAPVGGALDSLYTVNWPTAGWPTGIYHVWSRAVDCACNSSTCECNWYVEIVNPVPAATISVCVPTDDHHDGVQGDGSHHSMTCNPAVVICDTVSVKDGDVNVNLVPALNGDIAQAILWIEKMPLSDVKDQWVEKGPMTIAGGDTMTYTLDLNDLTEGTYRVRAFYKSTSGQWIDDGNSDGYFDDFTFDPAHKPWQMWLKVDRSVTPFTVAIDPTMTLKAGRQVKVTVTPSVACDVAQVCYGAVAENGYAANAANGCVDSLHFAFNPVDSGLVSLNHGIFHGAVRTTVTDALGNSSYVDTPLWILDMDSNQVRITSPIQGTYVTGVGDTLVKSVTARKLTSASIDSVVFFYAGTQAGAGTRFGKATSTAGSDEFMADWNIANVAEGDQYIWGVAYKGATPDNNPIRTWVTIIKTPKDIQLAVDTAHSIYAYRTVGPDKILFVGSQVDLGLNKDAISSIVSGVGIDSVVFCYRYADAPGGVVPHHPDPDKGWVRIGVDRYGSLHTDWFTPKDDSHGDHGHYGYHHDKEDCFDGAYAVAAWVYDKAGQVNHSNIVLVMVDNTAPYSEIVNIDGDEAFGTCHDITLTGNQTSVKFTAVGIDDRSCIGSTPAYNSGAKTLQFFVGHWDPSEDVGVLWGSDLVPLADGQDNAFALWNPSGLKTGSYRVWTVVTDQLGNTYTSAAVKLCVYDKIPPVGYIAGFGMSTDEHMNHTYTIYGSSWDTDVDHVQIQYRKASSNSPTDWTGIGLPKGTTHHDPMTWYTTWNPCVEVTGDYVFRMVPTDESGNENFDIQPILRAHVAACAVTPLDSSVVGVGFEDRPDFTDLGTVNLTNAPTSMHTSMIGVWANLEGDLKVEDIDLLQDVGDPTHFVASFDDGLIRQGGTGWFWAAYNDFTNLKTYLKKGQMKVYRVTDVGLPGTLTNPDLGDQGTSVEIQPGALTSTNGVVMFPARDPTVWKSQLYLKAWPISATSNMVTSIRLTDRGYSNYTGDTVSPQGGSWGHGGFNQGKYAKITISYYAPDIPTGNLAIAWWDDSEGEWVTNHGLLAGGQIQNGQATFFSDDLYGLYAVVSNFESYNTGAVDVQHTAFLPSLGSVTNAYPTFHTLVRSKLTGQHENSDIDARKIIVTVDGVTLYTGGEAASGWSGQWDEISGLLELKPYDVPTCSDYYANSGGSTTGGSGKVTTLDGLASGSHWIKVQAFSKQGYWNFDSTQFTVDATEPKVTPEDARTVCPNATFHVTLEDNGAGINWDSVFIDVHDFDASNPTVLPLSRLITTLSKGNFAIDGNDITFTVNASISQMRRVKLVIYDGVRVTHTECGCVLYDHICDGVPDMVGNHTQIVEATYTVDGTACTDTTGGTSVTVTSGGAGSNPFDPYTGGYVSFNLNGFSAGGGQVTAHVYDLTGEQVKGLAMGSAGTTWDGSDDQGDKVAEGVYLVHFQRSGGTALGATSQVIKVVVKRK